MKKISNESMEIIERTCDLACESLSNDDGISRQDIVRGLYKKLRFKKAYEVEKNFGYIYNEVANFDKLFDGSLRVVSKTTSLQLCYNEAHLRHTTMYKLFLGNDVTFITLKIVQHLHRAVLLDSGVQATLEFILPMYISDSASIYVIQDGISEKLYDKEFIDRCINFVNNRALKQISKECYVNISESHDYEAQLIIYYDGHVDLCGSTGNYKDEIAKYLTRRLVSGDITAKDLQFDKKVRKSKDIIPIITSLDVKFTKFCSTKEINKFVELQVPGKKVEYDFSNDSKIKITVIKYEPLIHNRTVNLNHFINKILKPNFSELTVKTISGRLIQNGGSLITKSGDILPKEDFKCDLSSVIYFHVEKKNKNFIPYISTNVKGKGITKTLLEKKLVKDEESGNVYLYAYYYMKIVDKSQTPIEEKHQLLRLVYQFKSSNFSYGTKLLNDLVIPFYVAEKSCLVDFEIPFFDGKNQLEVVEINTPWISAAGRNMIKDVFETYYNNDKFNSYTSDKELDISLLERKVTFLKEDWVPFSELDIKEEYSEKLTEEQIQELEQYYK